MKTFYVNVRQVLDHSITVEADSEEEARQIALEGDDSHPQYRSTDTQVIEERIDEIYEAGQG